MNIAWWHSFRHPHLAYPGDRSATSVPSWRACSAARCNATPEMSTAVTCQRCLASQMASAPSPQPASSALPGMSAAVSWLRYGWGLPLHSEALLRYRSFQNAAPSSSLITSSDAAPPPSCGPKCRWTDSWRGAGRPDSRGLATARQRQAGRRHAMAVGWPAELLVVVSVCPTPGVARSGR